MLTTRMAMVCCRPCSAQSPAALSPAGGLHGVPAQPPPWALAGEAEPCLFVSAPANVLFWDSRYGFWDCLAKQGGQTRPRLLLSDEPQGDSCLLSTSCVPSMATR